MPSAMNESFHVDHSFRITRFTPLPQRINKQLIREYKANDSWIPFIQSKKYDLNCWLINKDRLSFAIIRVKYDGQLIEVLIYNSN